MIFFFILFMASFLGLILCIPAGFIFGDNISWLMAASSLGGLFISVSIIGMATD